MTFKKHAKKFAAGLISGILMPVFLLGLKPAEADSAPVKIIFASKDQSFRNYDLQNLTYMFGGSGLPHTYKAQATISQFSLLKNDPGTLYAELDQKVSASAISVSQLVTTNDSYFTTDQFDEDRQWYLPKIHLPEAWNYGKGSKSVKVAVIDTGIHASHLDLNDGRIVEGYNVVNGKSIPFNSDSDDNGHGTAVAGVIGAISNNGRGIAGINWDVSIMPVKALEADGTGDISSISSAIVWAATNGADIINLSLGGSGFGNDQTLNNAIIYAYERGSLIIAAAGNDTADNGISLDSDPVYPVCADGGRNMVIGVAATDVSDHKAAFSNYGVNCVDISAPGKRILTTAYIPSDPADNVLIYGSGTSLATPVVTGVAALLKANNLSMTNDQLKKILLSTSDNIDGVNQNSCLGLSCNGFLGKGRLNALSALSPQPILDGSLVREAGTNRVYLVSGGRKRLVSEYVFQQRGFSSSSVISEYNRQLANYESDKPLPPTDGLLVKSAENQIVYYVHNGQKLPLTYLVFLSRNFKFSDVKTIPYADLVNIVTGEWYWPPDGTMVVVKGDPTVYVMDNGVKRPVTYFVFTQRKLSFAKVVNVTPDEFSHVPKAPDQYWMPPLDGTLVKSDRASTVYVIMEGIRRPVTYETFQARKFKFTDIKTLPQAEIDVIQEGLTL